MTIQDFKAKWRNVGLKESAASQEHFIDLCHALGMQTPADLDSDGAFYTFERGVAKTGGGKGFADVWYRNHFAWEYKGRPNWLDQAHQTLDRAAYGWLEDLLETSNETILRRLMALNLERSESGSDRQHQEMVLG